MSVLAPLSHALAAVVAGAHAGLTSLGADPDAGATWALSIAAVVVVVRTALLPLVIHGVRSAHAAARARPALRELGERFKGKRDPDSLRAHAEERRAIAAEHGMSRLGCLPMLLQMPVWIALYHLLRDVARGHAVGAMGADLVASLGVATIAGVRLADHGYAGAGAEHLAVVAGLALTAAAALVPHPAVPARPEHGDRRPARGHAPSPAPDADALRRRHASRRGIRAGGAAGLRGRELRLDLRPVGGDLALVPDAGLGCRRPSPAQGRACPAVTASGSSG